MMRLNGRLLFFVLTGFVLAAPAWAQTPSDCAHMTGASGDYLLGNSGMDCLDKAVHESAVIALDGDGTTALTAAQFQKDGFLEFTGALTADETVTLPAGVEHSFRVENSSTGGFDIIVGYATGATVTVAPAGVVELQADTVDVKQIGGAVSPLTTKGDLYTYGTGNDRLAVGANGQFLTADNAEATGLKWATGGAGGTTVIGLSQPDLETIDIQDLSAAGTVTFSGIVGATWDNLVLESQALTLSADDTLVLELSTGATFHTGATDYAASYHGRDTTAEVQAGNANQASIPLGTVGGTGANETARIEISIGDPGGGDFKKVGFTTIYEDSAGVLVRIDGSGRLDVNTNAIDGMRVDVSGAATMTGKWVLRGRRKAEAFSVLTNAGAMRGAIARLSADQSVSNAINTPLNLGTVDFDTDSAVDLVNDKYVVPVGVSKIAVVLQINFAANNTERRVAIVKKGGVAVGRATVPALPNAGNDTAVTLTVMPLEVATGDEITFEARQDSGGSINVTQNNTHVGIVVLEPTPSGKSIALLQVTDATETSLLEAPLLADSTVTLDGLGNCYEDATGDDLHFKVFAAGRNEAGTSTHTGDLITILSRSGSAAWTLDSDVVDGASDILRLRFTGEAAHTIDCKLFYEALQTNGS